MKFSPAALEEIKSRIPVEDLIGESVDLKKAGPLYKGLCPFHNERTPSFTVYPSTQSFYCFGCGVGGDIFGFTMQSENLSYPDAVQALAVRAGITIDKTDLDDSKAEFMRRIYAINRETAKAYHNYLMSENGKWGLEYYTERGLSLSTIRHFGLGAAPDSFNFLKNHLNSLGFNNEELYIANVLNKKDNNYYDRFRHRYIFPIIDVRGNVVAFSGRATKEEEAKKTSGKYVNTSDTLVYKKSHNLFGLNFAKNHCAEQMIIVEGNMDVITLHQAGFQNTVAPMGTSFTKEQCNLLRNYTKEVILTFDADGAGQKAVSRAQEILKNSGLKVKIAKIPSGKDPDEYVKTFGREKFQAVVDNALSEEDFLLGGIRIDTSTPEGKAEYLKAAVGVIAGFPDAITREIYIGQLTEKFNINRATLENSVKNLLNKKKTQFEKKRINDVVHPKYTRDDLIPEANKSPRGIAAEKVFLSTLLKHQNLIKKAEEKLPPEQFISSQNKQIYNNIINLSKSENIISISTIINHEDMRETGYITTLFNNQNVADDPEMILNDCIEVILSEHNRLYPSQDGDWLTNISNAVNKRKGE